MLYDKNIFCKGREAMNTKDNFMLVKNQRITSNQRLSAKAKRRLEKAKAET